MRWWVYLPLSLLVGLTQMMADGIMSLPYLRIEWLYLIALHTALRSSAWAVVPSFWLAGLVHDMFIGSHLGANTVCFTLVGLFVLTMRKRAHLDHFIINFVFVFGSLLILSIARPLLEGVALRSLLSYTLMTHSMIGAAISAILSPIVGRVMHWPLLQTWPSKKHPYGFQLHRL